MTTGFAGRMDRNDAAHEAVHDAAHADRAMRIARLRRLATLLDAAVRLPGGVRVGADAVIGLVPVVGDVAMALLGAYIIAEAGRMGLPRRKIIRMAVNLGIDGMFGAVPLVGDVFDVMFRANLRNVRIVEEHFARQGQRFTYV